MSIKANLLIKQGEDYSVKIQLQNYDLTGHQVSSQVRKSYSSSTAKTFVTSNTGANGEIYLSMNNANTSSLVPGRYVYDVKITSPGGQMTRVVEGIVTVTPGVTTP
jgi:hypothetical protein